MASRRERRDELLARQYLERALGAPLGLHDRGGRSGAHDYCTNVGGHGVATEVTRHTNPVRTATRSEWLSSFAEGRVLPGLCHGWWVSADPDRVRIKACAEGLSAALEDLENAGFERADSRVDIWDEDPNRRRVAVKLDALGINSAHRLLPDQASKGQVTMSLGSGDSSSTDPNDLATYIATFLTERAADVDKLARSEADRQELFVWVDLDAPMGAQWLARHESRSLPSVPIDLPRSLTSIWWHAGGCWRFSLETGWESLPGLGQRCSDSIHLDHRDLKATPPCACV